MYCGCVSHVLVYETSHKMCIEKAVGRVVLCTIRYNTIDTCSDTCCYGTERYIAIQCDTCTDTCRAPTVGRLPARGSAASGGGLAKLLPKDPPQPARAIAGRQCGLRPHRAPCWRSCARRPLCRGKHRAWCANAHQRQASRTRAARRHTFGVAGTARGRLPAKSRNAAGQKRTVNRRYNIFARYRYDTSYRYIYFTLVPTILCTAQ